LPLTDGIANFVQIALQNAKQLKRELRIAQLLRDALPLAPGFVTRQAGADDTG